MNNAKLNGQLLNGSPYLGKNATLTGGVGISSIVSAGFLVGIVLIGGLASASDAQGRVSAHLSGGAASAVTVSGKLRMTTNLQGAIYGTSQVGSLQMSFDPALKDGIRSPSGFGGQIKTHVRLQMRDQLGQKSVVGGLPIRAATNLNGGVPCTGYVGGGIRGSTVLVSDGIKSKSKVDSLPMKLGRSLLDGVYSTPQVGGKLFQNAILSGGFLSTHEVGKEIDINALLQGAIFSLNEVGGPLRISMVGNYGLESSATFGAAVQLSSAANGGVASSATLGGAYNISVKLPSGIASSSIIDGKGITASQILRNGITSANGNFISGQLKTHAKLQGMVASSSGMGGDIVQGFLDPLLNTWALEIRSATVLLEVKHPTEDI